MITTADNIYLVHPARTMPFDLLYSGLQERVQKGYINVQTWRDLEIFTYSRDCTFDKAWDVFTLMARGLILCPSQKKVVCTPFVKFFNYAEFFTELPNEGFTVTEKLDGSLGLLFFWDGEWWVVTKGSFQSEQAVWATDWFRKNVNTKAMCKTYSYLFEIIYPENRIVVRYDFSGLVLLGIYNDGGAEIIPEHLELFAVDMGVRCVPQKHYNSLDELLALAETMDISSEGFVVRFNNGFRIKIKGVDYCRVHRLVSYCTPLAVWEMLANMNDMTDILKDLPEEFHTDFTNILHILEDQFAKMYAQVAAFYEGTKDVSDRDLGMGMADKYAMTSPVAKANIFNARKKNWLEKVLEKPDCPTHPRISFFNKWLRPTSNKLEGYIPSSVVSRFQQESL